MCNLNYSLTCWRPFKFRKATFYLSPSDHLFFRVLIKGRVTRSNFSCSLQGNKRCVASCKKKFTCNTHLATAIVALRVARKVERPSTFLHYETSCLRVTSPQQLATQFCQNGLIRAHFLFARDFHYLVCYCARCKLRKKLQTCDTPSATWNVFIQHRCVGSCKKNCFM